MDPVGITGRRLSDGAVAVAVLTAVFVASRVAARSAGLGFDFDPLPGYWQLLDVEWMRHDLWRSLWYLHSQPPLFNLALGLGVRWGVLEAWAPLLYSTMAYGVQLGSYRLLRGVGLGRLTAVTVACWIVLRPGFLLTESWLMYDLPTIFLVVASAVAVGEALAAEDGRHGVVARHAAGWLLAALVLTRSLFHLGYVVLVLALLAVGRSGPCRRPALDRRWLAAFAVPLTLLAGVYVKNLALFGEPSSSSWFAMNFARVLRAGLDETTLERLLAEGRVPAVLDLAPFGALEDYEDFGVNVVVPQRWQNVPVLSEPRKSNGSVNYHHAGWLAVSREYERADRAVLGAAPWAWPIGVAKSCFYLLQPVGETLHLRSRDATGDFSRYRRLGRWLSLPIAVEISNTRRTIFGTFCVAVPLALAAASWWSWRLWRRRRPGWRLAVFLTVTCLYVVTVGCLFEVGENARFRSYVDPLLVVATCGAARQLRGRRGHERADRRRSEP